jgi:2-oxoglutarate dehydrogenase complex dehydrogenase (E1) component-like enzyme
MTPKSLLRNPAAFSPLADFRDSGFLPLIDDPLSTREAESRPGARALLFCSGKVYYGLARKKEAEGRRDVAIARIERLYPFPEAELRGLIASYPNARAFAWVQEESRNRGAWNFARDRFEEAFPGSGLRYIGRRASASPATGSHARHAAEEAELLASAFEIAAGTDA